MRHDFDHALAQYADVIIRVGLNLQPGQRLLISGPSVQGGVSLAAAPLVRHVVASAYRHGAPYVEVLWADPVITRSRFELAAADSFGEFAEAPPHVYITYMDRGDALLVITADDPDLLAGQDPTRVGAAQRAAVERMAGVSARISRNLTNWCVAAASVPAWAERVFPHLSGAEADAALWDTILRINRIDTGDAVAAWQAHLGRLATWRNHLNARQYTALHLTGPGADLTIGLPAGHLWGSGSMHNTRGVPFTANVPTEEVFTLPHRERVDGTVRATKPLSRGGALIEDFSVTFAGGRVVDLTAARGEALLRQVLETDEGASHLGEIALVPHSSPISQSGLLFYNTLFDENASSHIALGNAYKFTLDGGASLSDEEFQARGGNVSREHVDFMIGSDEMDVDGITRDGRVERLMRRGEWAFTG